MSSLNSKPAANLSLFLSSFHTHTHGVTSVGQFFYKNGEYTYHTGGGNVLTKLCTRDKVLSRWYVIVWNKYNLQEVANIWVIIHFISDLEEIDPGPV